LWPPLTSSARKLFTPFVSSVDFVASTQGYRIMNFYGRGPNMIGKYIKIED
jgi:hypothetical protein